MNYKLKVITFIQKQLHCNKGYWNTHNLQKKSLDDLKRVAGGFAPVIKSVNIDSILMALFVDKNKKALFRIQDSPHYKFLMGDTEPYLQYYKKYLDKTQIKQESAIRIEFVTKFNSTTKNNSTNYIKLAPFKKGYYYALEGDHRLAILKYKKEQNIIISIKCV